MPGRLRFQLQSLTPHQDHPQLQGQKMDLWREKLGVDP